MPDLASDAEELAALEQRRYRAIVADDYSDFLALAHPELVYSHSNGALDTLDSYVEKWSTGFYRYEWIEHPIESIVVVGDVGLVVGRMKARLDVDGAPVELDNGALAVWVRDGVEWRFLAYQPNPGSASREIADS